MISRAAAALLATALAFTGHAQAQDARVQDAQAQNARAQDARAQDVGALPVPDTMATQPDPTDFVGRADGVLMFQGNPRRFGGMGVSWLGLVRESDQSLRFATPYEVRDILSTVSVMASGMARSASLGVTAGCTLCVVPAAGQINADALRHTDMVLRQARDAGIKLIIPLAGGAGACPADGTPDPAAGTACVFAGFHHLDAAAFYTDPATRADFAATVTRMLNHINPFTGIAYKDDPTILAWENCDGCGQGVDAAKLADWTEFLGRTIKRSDSRHLYENGAFAGRLGRQPGHVPNALVALPSVDVVGDRVLPGLDPTGVGLGDAADQVTRANRVFLVDAYGWTPAQFPTQADFLALTKAMAKNREIAGAYVSELSGHAGQGGYLPATSPVAGAALFFPGRATPDVPIDVMDARARAVRRFSFAMNDMLTLPFSNVGAPEIIGVAGGRVTWRGAAGATRYSIARSPNMAIAGSWQTLCDACVTDTTGSWQDPSPSATPVWYRIMGFNANDHSGMYSDPVRTK
jgi:mannan endo-1,4-beta-mannosidase